MAMRIAVDAMGGDKAPQQILDGALESLSLLKADDELFLVGNEEIIRSRLGANAAGTARIHVEPASQVIGMDESPVEAVRQKRDSSIVKMVKLAAAGKVDAIISAGNTGALVAAGVLMLKTLPGVDRPGIAVNVPTPHGVAMLCDAGANVSPKPAHLHQYAVLASLYYQAIHGKVHPRVGLLNVGTEQEKGTSLVKEARQLISADTSIRFVGFVEGRDIFAGGCDVVVTDGFTGNVALKVMEGMNSAFIHNVHAQLRDMSPEVTTQIRPAMDRLLACYDHEEHGGALLLGVSSIFMKVHGSSGAKAIQNAVKAAYEIGRKNVNASISARLVSSIVA
jgi:glycerol-3-phosphate acyltransferase PlsX